MLLFYLSLIETESEKKKLEAVYKKYRHKMWYAAKNVLHDDFLAEDAVHDAFIGISKNIGSIGDVDSAMTAAYVTTAAKHAAINILHKQNKITTVDISEMYDLSDKAAEEAAENAELLSLAKQTLLSMPETYRDVLYYYLVEGMREKDIAALLSRNAGTVRQQIRRGKALFTQKMQKGDKQGE